MVTLSLFSMSVSVFAIFSYNFQNMSSAECPIWNWFYFFQRIGNENNVSGYVVSIWLSGHIPGCELHDLFVNVCLMVGGLWSVCGCMNHVERSLNVWEGVSQNLWSYSCLWGYVSGCEVSTHFFGTCPCIWGVWPDLERTFQYLRSLQCLWVAFQFVRSLICLGGISGDMRFLICLIMCLPEC